ncbi:hypothetical protein MMC20_003216 [Loxospora ochrophaea]|nr:hypothetical protein [Loxospora ochrophaea]
MEFLLRGEKSSFYREWQATQLANQRQRRGHRPSPTGGPLPTIPPGVPPTWRDGATTVAFYGNAYGVLDGVLVRAPPDGALFYRSGPGGVNAPVKYKDEQAGTLEFLESGGGGERGGRGGGRELGGGGGDGRLPTRGRHPGLRGGERIPAPTTTTTRPSSSSHHHGSQHGSHHGGGSSIAGGRRRSGHGPMAHYGSSHHGSHYTSW